MNRRIGQLDTLRGLAAVAVINQHYMRLSPLLSDALDFKVTKSIQYLLFIPPVYLLYAGHVAVVAFFVLSGFVLMIPFLDKGQNNSRVSYFRYALRRICRIYIPYIACMAITIVIACVITHRDLSGLSDLYLVCWSRFPTLGDLVGHLFLIGSFDVTRYNPVIWSLVIEMQISLIFPVVAAIVRVFDWYVLLALAIMVAVTATISAELLRAHTLIAGSVFHLYWLSMFILGATGAKYRVQLHEWVTTLRPVAKNSLAVLGLMLCSAECLRGFIHSSVLSHPTEQMAAAGTLILIILSTEAKWMMLPPLEWLGRISYSFYLWHVPVLLVGLHLGYGRVPFPLLLIASYAFSFFVAEVAFRAFESPAIRLSKRVGRNRDQAGIRSVPGPIAPL